MFMKKLGVLILLMLAAGPLAAQDDAAGAEPAEEATGFGTTDEASAETAEAADAASDAGADAAVADSEVPADAAADAGTDAAADATADAGTEAAAEAAVLDDSVAEDGAVAEESLAVEDSAVVDESVAVEESTEASEFTDASSDSVDAAPADESEPWELYVGTDYVSTRAKFSDNDLISEFGGDDFDSSMVRARFGMRLFQKIGVEVQLGSGTDDTGDLEADEYSTQEFYGAYLVPTGVLFDLFEVGASIGFAHTKLETATASETLSGVSFGVNIDVPLYSSEAVELRVGGGGSMFRAQNSAQISGYYAGIRVDFRI
jgi:hypothetical protein